MKGHELITVLHLVTGLNMGGAEVLLFDLVSRSDRSTFKHIVVSMLDEGVFGSRIRDNGIVVHCLNMKRGHPSAKSLLRLLSILHDEQPDLIQTWMYHADLLGAIVSGFYRRIPLIWCLHAAELDVSQYGNLTDWTRRLCIRLSWMPAVVTANSEITHRNHVDLGYRPRQWKLIPNGFDLDKFRPDSDARVSLRDELGLTDDAMLIGLIARYDPMKDHTTFLRGAALLHQMEPRVQFVLAGGGVTYENEYLAGLVEELGLQDCVRMLGIRTDISRVTAALDIATSSSSFGESFSNSIAEAMACGVPCVVTDVANLPFLVGDTGVVVPPQNPNALANGWWEMISVGFQDRRLIGLKARTRIELKFSLEQMISGYEELYHSLAEI